MAKAAACWPLGWADDCAGTQLGGSWANFYFMKKAASAGGLARQITRVLRAALAELEATEFAAKEMPTQQRVKPVAKAGIKAVLPDSVLAVVRADYAAGMGLADIANKHALYAKHGMYFTDGEPACR